MWLFTRYGFYSVSWQGREFAIRARTEHHLRALMERFPHLTRGGREIVRTLTADYHWRLMVPRKTWIAVLCEIAGEQEWSNFKAEAERFNGKGDYVEALHEVWGTMYSVQLKDAWLDDREAAREEVPE